VRGAAREGEELSGSTAEAVRDAARRVASHQVLLLDGGVYQNVIVCSWLLNCHKLFSGCSASLASCLGGPQHVHPQTS